MNKFILKKRLKQLMFCLVLTIISSPAVFAVGETSDLSIMLFGLFGAAIFLIPSFVVERFSASEISNIVVRRALMIIGIYFMILNASIAFTVADKYNLNVTGEIITYTTVFGWIGYLAIIFLFMDTLFRTIRAYKLGKQKEITGEE